MFNLTIDGKTAVISQGKNYLLQRYNPMLDFDSVRGAKMLDFVLPWCDANNKIFSNYGHPQVRYNFKKYYAELSFAGRVIERGFVQLKSVSSSGFVVFYTQNLGEIFGDYQKTTLNMLPFGSEAIPGVLNANPDPMTAKFCFPTIENPAFYGTNGGSISYLGFVNNYVDGAYTAGPKVPMMFLRYVLKRIGEICDIKIKGSFFSDLRVQRLILYNTFSLDGATNISYANHLPEISIPDFLKELRKMFNLALFFDTNKRELSIEFVDVMLAQAVVRDWSNKFPRLTNKAPVLDNRIELECELDTNDASLKPVPTFFEKYSSAIGSEGEQLFPIKTKFSSLLMNGAVPKTEQVGISPQFNQGNNKFAPRLLFFEGLVSGSPKASNTYGGVSLSMASLAANFYARYERFRRNTHSTTTPATLSAYDISVIDSHRKGFDAAFAIHAQGNNYLIGNQQIQLPNNKVILDLWKM
ncbi:hypothetical protein [Emticicia sp. W12TSBA100-4]|uniref:hypothetical protein n=1 Tax=Emticicia sp. W12TSBA100-4 TaxID=3160965 RepID=UPI0033068809